MRWIRLEGPGEGCRDVGRVRLGPRPDGRSKEENEDVKSQQRDEHSERLHRRRSQRGAGLVSLERRPSRPDLGRVNCRDEDGRQQPVNVPGSAAILKRYSGRERAYSITMERNMTSGAWR